MQTEASQRNQDDLVKALRDIDPKHIKRAKRVWDTQNYAKRGMGYGYFKGICLRCADESSRDSTLDSLPPLFTEEDL